MTSYTPKLRVLITLPVYNEAQLLERHIILLHEYCKRILSHYEWLLLIVDNGSTDETQAIAYRLSQEYPLIAHLRLEERGRGYALKTAWLLYDASVYLYMDIDIATDLNHLRTLIDTVAYESYDLVIGSRNQPVSQVKRSLSRSFISWWYNMLARALLPAYHISDSQCGFKAISKTVRDSVVPHVLDTQWFFDTELLARSIAHGYQIKEIPISWIENRFTKRKSTVKLIRTSLDHVRDLIRLRREL